MTTRTQLQAAVDSLAKRQGFHETGIHEDSIETLIALAGRVLVAPTYEVRRGFNPDVKQYGWIPGMHLPESAIGTTVAIIQLDEAPQ